MTEKRIKYWARTLRKLRAECYESLGIEGDYMSIALMDSDGEDWCSITVRAEDESHPYISIFGDVIERKDF